MKRARTANVQYFKRPFRTDVYKKHHVNVHPEKWQVYSALSSDEKKEFFNGVLSVSNTLHAHFDSEVPLRFTFNRDIVDVLIGELLFDPDDVENQKTKQRVLQVFKPFPDASTTPATEVDEDANRDAYEVVIRSSRLFFLVLGYISKGSSFRMASRLCDVTRQVTKMSCFSGASEDRCATFARVICASSYQCISDLLRGRWGFSLALDVGHAQGTKYLDLRIRFHALEDIVNVHLVALPIFDRKTAPVIFGLCSRFLDVVCPDWREKLLGVSTDGERTMTGRIGGVATLFASASTFGVMRVWCGLHQVDLVCQAEYKSLYNEQFVSVLTGLVSWLRRQYNFISDVKSTCPKFVDTRWASMKKLTSWLELHVIQVLQYLDQKKPSCTPPKAWWVQVLALDRVALEISRTVQALQGLTTLISQQASRIQELVERLSMLCTVDGPVDPVTLVTLEDSVLHVVRGSYSVSLYATRQFIYNLGSVAIEMFEDLSEEDSDAVVKSIASLFAGLADGLSKVVSAPNRNNQELPLQDELPPVLPRSLVHISGSKMGSIVRRYKTQLLEHGWAPERVYNIEREHRELLGAYHSELPLRNKINECEESTTDFKTGWQCTVGRWPDLQALCGTIATVFPNTATVESDFSLIGWEKDAYRTSLTDFSLEGILHAKQYDRITALARQCSV